MHGRFVRLLPSAPGSCGAGSRLRARETCWRVGRPASRRKRARCIPSEGPSGQARQYGHKGATKHLSSVWHKERIYSYDGALEMDDVAGPRASAAPVVCPGQCQWNAGAGRSFRGKAAEGLTSSIVGTGRLTLPVSVGVPPTGARDRRQEWISKRPARPSSVRTEHVQETIFPVSLAHDPQQAIPTGAVPRRVVAFRGLDAGVPEEDRDIFHQYPG